MKISDDPYSMEIDCSYKVCLHISIYVNKRLNFGIYLYDQ